MYNGILFSHRKMKLQNFQEDENLEVILSKVTDSERQMPPSPLSLSQAEPSFNVHICRFVGVSVCISHETRKESRKKEKVLMKEVR